ncbi:hypothetical protein G7Y89_g11218 [Cudoniella acicularis]|uniref:N-acetyltransferase domain-containing protein n=1 Tax=Cudoniella acicularis TaxID=354080 RepID=A0A8H4RDM0_9HELO|nr:hypothetical protein G7Y89_g11218 [Cudoniella acicularis]
MTLESATKLDSESQTFSKFLELPIELRLRIWRFAAPRRPRVIQVNYNAKTQAWEACMDGCGGLPSVVHVCREARSEALKPYTRVFGAYFDLKNDTLFISDPIFSLRHQRNRLTDSEHTKSFRNVAFSHEVYHGLRTSHVAYPLFCDSPSTILRGFNHLEHFSLVLLEDEVDYDDDVYDSDEELENLETYDDEGDDTGEEEGLFEEDSQRIHGPYNNYGDYDDEQNGYLEDEHEDESSEGGLTAERGALNEEEVEAFRQRPPGFDDISHYVLRTTEQRLNAKDQQALDTMCKKGYFRRTGNVHFQTAYESAYGRLEIDRYLVRVFVDFQLEKTNHQAWVRPTVSIVTVKSGLKELWDFNQDLHYEGDHPEFSIRTSYLALRKGFCEKHNMTEEEMDKAVKIKMGDDISDNAIEVDELNFDEFELDGFDTTNLETKWRRLTLYCNWVWASKVSNPNRLAAGLELLYSLEIPPACGAENLLAPRVSYHERRNSKWVVLISEENILKQQGDRLPTKHDSRGSFHSSPSLQILQRQGRRKLVVTNSPRFPESPTRPNDSPLAKRGKRGAKMPLTRAGKASSSVSTASSNATTISTSPSLSSSTTTTPTGILIRPASLHHFYQIGALAAKTHAHTPLTAFLAPYRPAHPTHFILTFQQRTLSRLLNPRNLIFIAVTRSHPSTVIGFVQFVRLGTDAGAQAQIASSSWMRRVMLWILRLVLGLLVWVWNVLLGGDKSANPAALDAFFKLADKNDKEHFIDYKNGERRNRWHVQSCVVAREWNGKGIGKRLMAEVIQRAERENVIVGVEATDEGEWLYRKVGFRLESRYGELEECGGVA